MLALDKYIPKHKSGSEGVVINLSSIAGVMPVAGIPVYTATKFAILGLTFAWGLPRHYERTGVKVIGICPGITKTRLVEPVYPGTFSSCYADILKVVFDACGTQMYVNWSLNRLRT